MFESLAETKTRRRDKTKGRGSCADDVSCLVSLRIIRLSDPRLRAFDGPSEEGKGHQYCEHHCVYTNVFERLAQFQSKSTDDQGNRHQYSHSVPFLGQFRVKAATGSKTDLMEEMVASCRC